MQETVLFNYSTSQSMEKGTPSVTFIAYPQDKSIYLVSILNEYLARTKLWKKSDCQSKPRKLSQAYCNCLIRR